MTTKIKYLALFLSLAWFSSCDEGDNNPSGIDVTNVRVDEQLILYNPENIDLQFDGGYRYINGGRRGILVYRANSTDYRAFERTCPYDPNAACAQISVDQSTLFLIDTCCGSTFDFTGQVMGGPAMRPLARYSTSLNQNVLRITN